MIIDNDSVLGIKFASGEEIIGVVLEYDTPSRIAKMTYILRFVDVPGELGLSTPIKWLTGAAFDKEVTIDLSTIVTMWTPGDHICSLYKKAAEIHISDQEEETEADRDEIDWEEALQAALNRPDVTFKSD